tara:strand:- start:663 stop:809 length:147 start_codon:yes stop_codon:yes gene_type:complete
MYVKQGGDEALLEKARKSGYISPRILKAILKKLIQTYLPQNQSIPLFT